MGYTRKVVSSEGNCEGKKWWDWNERVENSADMGESKWTKVNKIRDKFAVEDRFNSFECSFAVSRQYQAQKLGLDFSSWRDIPKI
jgi:hypothetical protein